jgi:ribonuclease D
MVRELWHTRDAIAVERDTAPGRILPDAALVDLAIRSPRTDADVSQNGTVRTSRSVRRYQHEWLSALDRARLLPDAELPALTVRSDGPPPARAWADRDPVAATRLAQARSALGEVALARHLPVENLLTPDSLRRLLWTPPADPTPASISAALLKLGARQWQIDIASPIIDEAINRPVEPVVESSLGVSTNVTDE